MRAGDRVHQAPSVWSWPLTLSEGRSPQGPGIWIPCMSLSTPLALRNCTAYLWYLHTPYTSGLKAAWPTHISQLIGTQAQVSIIAEWFIGVDPGGNSAVLTWDKWKSESFSVVSLSNPIDCPWNSPGQNTGVGSLSLLQGIFPTQGSNPGLHCKWILYQLSHKGSPSILEWVAYPFSSGSFQLRNWTRVSFIAGGFFCQLSHQGSPTGLKPGAYEPVLPS